MERWLQNRIANASRSRFLAAAALLSLYAYWLFTLPSPWTRAEAATDARLPELIAGFPRGEPVATLARLGPAQSDYLWAQAYDLLFIALVVIAATSTIAIALKRLGMANGDARYVLFLPALYALAEAIENALLALFASGAVSPTPLTAILQQLATTAKLGALLLTVLFALAGAFAWAGFAIGRSGKRA